MAFSNVLIKYYFKPPNKYSYGVPCKIIISTDLGQQQQKLLIKIKILIFFSQI